MNNGCDYDCEYRIGEYCSLFDDVLGYESCIFRKSRRFNECEPIRASERI